MPEVVFALRLCLALGCTLGELCDRMDVQEFQLWQALYAVEPWGDIRADLRAGVVASTVVNWAGKTLKQGAPDKRPSDFLLFSQPKAQAPAAEPDPEQHYRSQRTNT